MRIALLIIGIACLVVGGYCLGWRHRIVARLSARPGARNVQAPMAYAVMGVTVGLAGVGLIVSGLT